MGSAVGEVEEERLLLFASLVDELHAPVGPEIGAVPLLAEDRVVFLLLLAVEENLRAIRLLAEVDAPAGELRERSNPRFQGGVPCCWPMCHLPVMQVR